MMKQKGQLLCLGLWQPFHPARESSHLQITAIHSTENPFFQSSPVSLYLRS